MKNAPAALAAALLLLTPAVHAQTASDYKSESRSISETFTSKVLKVYAFSEGNHAYAAYVLTWADKEVVAIANNPTEKPFVVGDIVRCFMRQGTPILGGSRPGAIQFTVVGLASETNPALLPGTTVITGAVTGDYADDAARLAAISAEVRRRRDARGVKGKPDITRTAPAVAEKTAVEAKAP